MSGFTCGVWLARRGRGLVDVVVDEDAHAIERGSSVWLVPPAGVDAVCIVANLAMGPPARTAAALARLPLAPVLRSHLTRLVPPRKPQ